MSADDLVIVDLAAENAALRDHISLTESYRALAQAGIEELYAKDREIERLRRRNNELIAENRTLRGSIAA